MIERDAGRRRFAQAAMAGVATATAGAMTPAAWAGASKLRRIIVGTNVAVVGAGLAGLSCASELARKGVTTHVFEAAARVGGRCSSLRGFFSRAKWWSAAASSSTTRITP